MPEGEPSIRRAVAAMKANRPLLAEEICRDHLHMDPGSIQHLALLGRALAKQGRYDEAAAQLDHAIGLAPEMPLLYEDLGSVRAFQGQHDDAVGLFEKAIRLDPRQPSAHRKLGEALAAAGRGHEADRHFESYFDRDPVAGRVAEGADHLRAGRADEAIATFRDVLRKHPDNVDAMRYLGIAYWREKKKPGDAEAWLRRATSVAPDFAAAWMNLGLVLLDNSKPNDAIAAYRRAVELAPDNAASWAGAGNAYAQAGQQESSVEAYAKSLALNPRAAGVHMSHGHALKTVGDQKSALAAYRAAIAERPRFGEVYWSMANLKVFRFEEAEIRAMEEQLTRGDLTDSERIHFSFALGKAYEDKDDYAAAWSHYDAGNRLQRPLVKHDPLELEKRHEAIRAVFNREFLARHAGNGHEAADPILIVGLPRSGSTLVEQILASHSQVEGTSELPTLGKIATSIGRYRRGDVQFPESATELEGQDWRAYGQRYLEDAARHRFTDRPFFTDKMPNNFPLLGLLHLILPNAKIIDARRHPVDSCIGCYKQLFAKGQNFTYDLEDLSHYYRSYDAMMNHWQSVLPGKVLTVHYEETVTDLEGQVRRILDHCGLPFEASCVRFHETRRAVRTASSEQVRQPIYSDALGTWRRYAAFCEWLVEDLRPIVDALPEPVRAASDGRGGRTRPT